MTNQDPGRSKSRLIGLVLRFGLALVAFVVIGISGYCFQDSLTLQSLAARESQLRDFFSTHPVATLAVAFLLYAAVTGLSIPGSVPLSLSYGWLFGFSPGVVVVSFASTTGASIAFLLSRYLLGNWVQSWSGGRLETFNQAMEKEGAFYLLTLRLVPAVPFFVINVVMGLTKIRLTTYWWVSQLGMLPATCIIVWAGASVPKLADLQERGTKGLLSLNMILALTALGLFPLVARWTLQRWKSKAQSSEP